MTVPIEAILSFIKVIINYAFGFLQIKICKLTFFQRDFYVLYLSLHHPTEALYILFMLE